ncbi:hypothetical protein SAMN05444483_101583 [Salegentibacter echinorum]|uniref:Uncharacterized protein n=1 Tax=Salegentibacter echinorum TaxID=1073325 RepID=A0A1M5CMV4_SALEC|nr:hypothetical protein [Salegentibacter echinorum]SHF55742.1 hypothetical protein SAMN05444483_101583 [Salegentibacter echinorum]
MKNLLTFIFLLTLLNGCGTDQGEGKNYIFTLVNSSGYDIRIDSFFSSEEDTEIIALRNGEEITKQFNSPAPPIQEYYSYISFFQGDSIVINYGNEKQQIFVIETNCNGNERNPLNICIYDEQQETFTFTEEDFENATPCDGDCN